MRDKLIGEVISHPLDVETRGKLLNFLLAEGDTLSAEIERNQIFIIKNPQDADAWYRLGVCFAEKGLLVEARKSYLTALKIREDSPTLYGLAAVCVGENDLEQAEGYYLLAAENDPEFIAARGGLCSLWERSGHFDAAKEILPRWMVDIAPGDLALPYANLCHQLGRAREGIEVLTTALTTTKPNNANLRRSLFTLGKLSDSVGDFEKAFMFYSAANKIKNAVYDPRRFEKTVSTLRKLFNRHDYRNATVSGNKTAPIFILGMPRTGSSLIEKILSAHPDVVAKGEISALSQSLPVVDTLAEITGDIAATAATKYVNMTGPGRTTDKNPGNFLLIGAIKILFPSAKIIHCRRDPRDTCLSIFFQDFVGGHSYAYDQKTIVHYYQQYLEIMAHWKNLGIEMLDIDYERVVSDRSCPGDIAGFCGLEWDEKLSDHTQSGYRTATASYQQVRKPIYTKSVGRWRHYEPWIGDIISGLKNFS